MELNQSELESAIESELNENPALERLDDDAEPITNETVLQTIAPQELRPGSEDFEFQRSLPNDISEDTDWVDLAASNDSLADHLRAQLLPQLSNDLRIVGEFIIGSLDERGYFQSSVEEVALACNCTLEEAEFVLCSLKQCEPAGVGASTVQECLLLQLRNANTLETKLARAILLCHFEDFLGGNTRTIARSYRVLPQLVHAAFEEVRRLTPYPGESFAAEQRLNRSCMSPVTPDLILSLRESGWDVFVPGLDENSLTISRSYRVRQRQLESASNASKEEKRHISEYVSRASNFIEAVRQRRQTMQKIGRYLIEKQSGFVSTGEYRFLQPLTRSQLAQAIGVHDSTVSRATQGKFVQLAHGEVVSFDVFFKPALKVQKMIEEILANENPNNPLSDERIAQMLADRGIQVARRTVNKYRDKTKLLSSRRRRTA